ncbi:hypothetical protein PoB_005602400 [Plakobranchus ocellatus]|uniref:Uncharacterized protein n=1 Tax=Plakobranchus ocellatus TaxID=259542 RepID=A0AAV4CFH7_9GAST|nr:hypothetical protein PoB_005602400 [Plakobranchus ocellatus]
MARRTEITLIWMVFTTKKRYSPSKAACYLFFVIVLLFVSIEAEARETQNGVHLDNEARETPNGVHLDNEARETPNGVHLDNEARETPNWVHLDNEARETPYEKST